MNCEWVKENAFLYAYDELADDQRFEFEQHVNRCTGCADEVKSLRGLRDAMSAAPVLEPSASLLASARMRLQEQLEIAQQEKGWKRWFYDPFSMLGQLKFSPALAAVLLMFGFAGGAGVAYKMGHTPGVGPIPGPGPVPLAQAQANVAGIREIQQDPTNNKVQIKYDTLQPQMA